MFSTKKEVIDYFDKLTNEIDIKFERKIQKLDNNEAISKQNVTRKLINEKINEIVQFNLEQLGKKVKSCVLFERKVWNQQIIDNLSDTESICQPVEITSLIIFSEILSSEFILNIKKKLRNVDFTIKGNFEKNFKLHLIHQLIYESYDAIIDISDSNANLIKQIEITDYSNEINEADLNFGFIDIKKIEKLDLRFFDLSSFSQKIFRNFETLLELDLWIENLKIFSGKFFSFKNLVQLRIKIFQVIYDNVLEPNHFKSLNKLKRLILVHNYISNIAENAFSGLESLEFLDLSYNKFKEIDGIKFKCLKNLNHLSIGANEENLDIHNCEFLKKLKILEIQNNCLVKFKSHDRFNQYSDIELINLTDTNCHGLSSIITFDKIKCLIMEKNISDFWLFNSFRNLEFLDLGSHVLLDYSEYLDCFENIKIFFTCGNFMKKCSPEKNSYRNLVYLRLKDLDDLEEDFFENFNSLKYLEVEFVDFDLFNNLINKNENQFISKYNYLNEMKFLKIDYKSNYKINFVKNLEEKKQLLINKFDPIDEISVQIDCEHFQIDYENYSSLNYIKIQTCKSPMECCETLKVSEITKKFLIKKYFEDI